jgi:hypothetical protein
VGGSLEFVVAEIEVGAQIVVAVGAGRSEDGYPAVIVRELAEKLAVAGIDSSGVVAAAVVVA